MTNLTDDQAIFYNKIAKELISTCYKHGLHDNIAVIGYFLVLIKQGKFDGIEDGEINYNIRLLGSVFLDEQNSFDLSDFISNSEGPKLIKSFSTICYFITKSDLDCAILYDAVINISAKESRHHGEYFQPKEVSLLIDRLLPDTTKIVYNPFAGIASYQIINSSRKIYGQEIKHHAWIIGKIRLLLNNINSDYVCENSISNWKGITEKFDAVISTPPFGCRIDQNIYKYNNISNFIHREYDSFYLDNALNSITPNGIVASIVSLAFLLRGNSSTQQFKRHIIGNGYVQKVILLPSNIFYGTSIKTAVVILTRTPNDGVVMVDGSNFFEKVGRQNILKYEGLLETAKISDSNCVKFVSNEEVIANDCNLNPDIYINTPSDILKVPDGFKLKKLKNLIYQYKGLRVDNISARLVRGKNLAEG